MNTHLEKLFDQHNISERNRYEINQMFPLLSVKKQQSLINNFELLVLKLEKIEEDMKIEQKILLDKIIPDINDIILKNKEKHLLSSN